MEHPGRFRKIPEHPGISRNMKKLKYVFMKKLIIIIIIIIIIKNNNKRNNR